VGEGEHEGKSGRGWTCLNLLMQDAIITYVFLVSKDGTPSCNIPHITLAIAFPSSQFANPIFVHACITMP
jgi:hypothetical protein